MNGAPVFKKVEHSGLRSLEFCEEVYLWTMHQYINIGSSRILFLDDLAAKRDVYHTPNMIDNTLSEFFPD